MPNAVVMTGYGPPEVLTWAGVGMPEPGEGQIRIRWLAAACADATILADDARLRELSRRMEAAAREQGAMIDLALALSHAGVSGLLGGDLGEAQRCFAELTAISEARGQLWSIGSLLITAWRGPPEHGYALLAQVADEADRQGQGCNPAGRGRGDQRGDRRPALPQPEHRRLPPAQGVPEARRQLPPPARPREARPGPAGLAFRWWLTGDYVEPVPLLPRTRSARTPNASPTRSRSPVASRSRSRPRTFARTNVGIGSVSRPGRSVMAASIRLMNGSQSDTLVLPNPAQAPSSSCSERA